METFDINSLNLDQMLSNDELVTIDAGGLMDISKNVAEGIKTGYTEATIIWSQIP